MLSRKNLLIILIFFITACSSDRLDVDVSDVEFEMQFEHFEDEMFNCKSVSEMDAANKQLVEKGQELYEFYVFDVLRAGSPYDDSVGTYLYYFITDTTMKMAYQDIRTEFGDFSEEEDQIVDMFKHLKYHLPKALLPEKLITYNSAFNYGVVSTPNKIGVGLEMYLGPENRIIQQVGFPVYVKDKMKSEYLMVDIAHSWLITNVMGENKGETFLSQMVYYGKLRYAIDAMLPNLPDHLKIRYTEAEYDWSLASEDDIWLYILDMNWVYSTDMKLLLRFFEEAPTTVGIEGSPGRIGQFMGWQMVKQYMEKNEEVSVADLLLQDNETVILKTYKPDNE
ncbi:hypothetical protein K6119_08240 [Paracrocinitomix mangrovi]|uniref:gliding motility lipoprotein GldB n=1 Tax=Paracrocinitomix mangrovi TaxID=2862509 RepID=UPI001C8E367E|nr:hypothetical protein [Paracrocinitomix mangrovi]UKN03502.1 hypothetical protein K6119_08240 [Paracrocinitomix mangrovi]